MAKRIALEQLKIASPCRASWDAMIGDDRTRFCNQCNKNVYNISDMSRNEAEALITKAEGKLCVRMFKRRDGTVLTSDCNVGAQSLRKRAWRVAGSAITATLSLLAGINVHANPRIEQNFTDNHIYVVSRTVNADKKDGKLKLTGRINNPKGGFIYDAVVTLINEQNGKQYWASVNSKGIYSIDNLDAAFYTIKVSARDFTPFLLDHLRLDASEEIIFNVSLDDNPHSLVLGSPSVFPSDFPDESANNNANPSHKKSNRTENLKLDKNHNLLSGTVADETGAVITGATVVLKNENTGEEFTTTTNEKGIYQLALPRALYSFKVSAEGFHSFALDHLKLKAKSDFGFNVTLDVGAMTGIVVFDDNKLVKKNCRIPVKPAKSSKEKK